MVGSGAQPTRWALAAALAICSLAPASAHAGSYTVWSCRGPDPQAAAIGAAGWRATTANASAGDVAIGDGCADGGGLAVSLAPTGTAKPAVGSWTFTPPAGTQIAGYELWRALHVPAAPLISLDDYKAVVVEGTASGPVDYGCHYRVDCPDAGDPAQPLSAANHVGDHGVPLSSLAVEVACTSSSCAATSGAPASAQLFRAKLTIVDPLAPTAPQLGGDLTAGGSTLTVAASDPGAGLRSFSLTVDGGAPRTLATGCAEPYVAAPPCPTAFAETFAVDRAALAPGDHSVSGSVLDAAGNVTFWGPLWFSVAEPAPVPTATAASEPAPSAPAPPPSAPPAPTASGNGVPAVQTPRIVLAAAGRDRAPGTAARVGGTLRTSGGAPIAGARLSVSTLPAGGRSRTLGGVTTDARGRFSVSVRGDGSQRLTISFAPSAGAPATASVVRTLRTRVVLSVAATPHHLHKGHVVTLRGRVRGAGAATRGALVHVQAIVDGRWAEVGLAKASAGGAYRWRYRFVHLRRDTAFSFRVVVEHASGWPWPTAHSRAIPVLVDVP